MESIFIQDQALRQLIKPAQSTFGEGSKELQYFFELMTREDRKNEETVIAIIESHGWPGISSVGQRANQTVWLVIQHAPLENPK